MTDESIVAAVTAKLRGEFYIGQRVRIDDLGYVGACWQGSEGTVRNIWNTEFGLRVGIDMHELSDGEAIFFEPRSVKPL